MGRFAVMTSLRRRLPNRKAAGAIVAGGALLALLALRPAEPALAVTLLPLQVGTFNFSSTVAPGGSSQTFVDVFNPNQGTVLNAVVRASVSLGQLPQFVFLGGSECEIQCDRQRLALSATQRLAAAPMGSPGGYSLVLDPGCQVVIGNGTQEIYCSVGDIPGNSFKSVVIGELMYSVLYGRQACVTATASGRIDNSPVFSTPSKSCVTVQFSGRGR